MSAGRDTQIHPTAPSQTCGDLPEISIQQQPTQPSVRALAAISFDNLFGNGVSQITPYQAIVEATLYVYVTSVSGSQTVSLRGLPPADSAWAEPQASFNFRATGTSWSGGDLETSLVGSLGTFDNPSGTGWLAIDVTEALRAYQTNALGGVATTTVSVTVRPIAQTPNSLSATRDGGSNVLRFSGIGGYRYEIQRSSDLISWTPLATLTMPAHGICTCTDPTPTSPAYYRTAYVP